MSTRPLEPGITNELEFEVTSEMVPRHLLGTTAQVLSTPHMIQVMEGTCHRSLAEYLTENQRSVGFEVHVRHLAPAPVGSRVRVTSELVEVEGRKLAFTVAAYQGDKKIGAGTIRRTIVEHQGFGQQSSRPGA